MNEKRPQTKREFLCRDHLWNLFQFVATDLGCSVDYLVNESMREYARSRGYSITEALRLKKPVSSQENAKNLDEPYEALSIVPAVIHPPEPVVYPGRLFIAVDGREVEVNKFPFVIGRGSRVTDLTISDANISRRHCEIDRRGNDIVIRDLGSTNGIEVYGVRVESHTITQNTSVYVCDYELRLMLRDG